MNVVYALVLFSLLHPLYYPSLMSSMCLNYLLALFPQVTCLILVLTFYSLLLVVLYKTRHPSSKFEQAIKLMISRPRTFCLDEKSSFFYLWHSRMRIPLSSLAF